MATNTPAQLDIARIVARIVNSAHSFTTAHHIADIKVQLRLPIAEAPQHHTHHLLHQTILLSSKQVAAAVAAIQHMHCNMVPVVKEQLVMLKSRI